MTSIQKHAGHHALVIGGSIAGLLTARVLADYFDTITIIDRDIFPLTPDHRRRSLCLQSHLRSRYDC